MRVNLWLRYAVLAVLAALTVVAFFKTPPGASRPFLVHEPGGIMGTDTRLVAVLPPGMDKAEANAALNDATAALRWIEILMSTALNHSELARFNAAGIGPFAFGRETLQVLGAAQRLYEGSGGAFDVTCGPLIMLWQKAGELGRLPAPEEIRSARAASDWRGLIFDDRGIFKKEEGLKIDLGGIAKGYAIDRAMERLAGAGCEGGLVDVGGDIRCFGTPMETNLWQIGVKHPFEADAPFARLGIASGAVCTSGNYSRFVEIEGKWYSHIIDPRTGLPAGAAASVTVAAPTAMAADGWATALSVLGPKGFEKLPEGGGIEALIVTGTPEAHEVHMTEGFRELLVEGPEL